MAEKYRILVTDGVSARGVGVFKSVNAFEVIEAKSFKEDELVAAIVGVDALVVRSQTKVTAKVMEAADRLKVVGRAGVGVDNVDVKAATQKGIVVMNTPGGNTISTAEHSFTLLLSLARHIAQAHGSIQQGKWDRKTYQGVEVHNKTLGIVGMGRIGTEVARRAIAFGMRVLAYDPYLSMGKARSLQVELYEKIEEMVAHCDFITLHIPMTPETKGLFGPKLLPLCKDGVRLVNCARGGLIDESSLVGFIESGKVAGAAIDVFEQEPLPADHPFRNVPQIIMTPHLGASTAEAQENVGIEIAESIRDMLIDGEIRNSVNVPNVDAKTMAHMRPYIELARKLGSALDQIAPDRCDAFIVNYSGKIKDSDTTAVTRAALRGYLLNAIGTDVNEVNVMHHAENLGLKISETKLSEMGDFAELISVKVKACSSDDTFEVSGTFFGSSPRIVRINGQNLEARPEGVLLVMENKDRPGIVGWVGGLMGKHKINIASMSLGRSAPGSEALSVLNLDSLPGQEVVDELMQDPDVHSVHLVEL